jgi:hypothetical protein
MRLFLSIVPLVLAASLPAPAAAQGKFRVERSSDGKRAFAVPDPATGAELIDPATGQPMKSKLETLELSELRERVKKAASPRSAQ